MEVEIVSYKNSICYTQEGSEYLETTDRTMLLELTQLKNCNFSS